ncbi:MAG: hypothetical protein P4L84_06795 [Isosphaeraceae bacterium]|nr:hypothetical protein [Isosphaeraceae bacterium]
MITIEDWSTPFANDDPKTAEAISKALLLARDAEIQDPTILALIRTGTSSQKCGKRVIRR